MIKLDTFGVSMNFYLKGNKDYRSNFGALVTISIYIVTIICGGIFANEFIIRNNPKVGTCSAIYNNPKRLYYPDNIFFMFSINIDSIPFIDDKIYRVIGHIRTKIKGTEILQDKKISLDKCINIVDQKYKFYDAIKHINLSNYYCISFDKEKNNGIERGELFINEFWGNDGFQMLQFKIYNCSAIANKSGECETEEIIQEKLERPILRFYTLKNYIDTNNYSNPYVRGLMENFYYLSYKKHISATEYLKHVEINSDIGLFFNNIVNNTDSTVENIIDFTETDKEDGRLFTMSLQLTNKIEKYSRSYYKIQDLGADIGAVYGVLRLISSIILNYYNTSKLFTNIINDVFLIKEDFKNCKRDRNVILNFRKSFYGDFKSDISLAKNISKDNISGEGFITSNNSFNNHNYKKRIKNEKNIKTIINQEISNNNTILKDVNKLIKEKAQKKIKIDFSFVDKVLCLFIIDLCKHRTNRYSYYNLFYKGRDYIIKILNINNYLKAYHFLLMFINEKEKRELYDYVTTPILSSNYIGTRFESVKQNKNINTIT